MSGPTRRIYGLLACIVVEMLVFALLLPDFWTLRNLLNTSRANSVLAIVAVGVTFGLISGAIDISVGSVIALSGVVAGELLGLGLPAPVAALGALATGVLVGPHQRVLRDSLPRPSPHCDARHAQRGSGPGLRAGRGRFDHHRR